MSVFRFYKVICIILTITAVSWAGTYSGGNGTAGNPYKISTATDWQELVGSSGDWSSCFVLTADIYLSGIASLTPIAPDTNPSRSSVFQGTAFTGVLDGNNHVIFDATINMPEDYFIGLVGYIGAGGEVRNLNMTNCLIAGYGYLGSIAGYNKGSIKDCYVDGSAIGGVGGWVGGLVGVNNEGIISNCYVTGVVDSWCFVGGLAGQNSGTIIDCYSMSEVLGIYSSATAWECLGGLVGENTGTVIGCYATGDVSGNCRVGGLVGRNEGSITDCYANGAVLTEEGHSIGGLAGMSRGTINNSYATGNVSATRDGGDGIGGLTGSNSGVINGCYARGSVNSAIFSWAGGLVGNHFKGTISNCYSTGFVTVESGFSGGLVGINRSTIYNCYSTGMVINDEGSAGGLIGVNLNGFINSSFWNIDSSDLTGSSGGKGLTTVQMKMMSVFSNAGWGNNEWVIADSVDYPHLSWEGTGFPNISSADPVPLEGLGTEEAPYQIWTPEEFALLSWYSSILDKHIVLMADINLNGKKLYPIGDLGLFSGVFDGKGYIISNAAIIQPNSDYVGLFGHIGIAGVVENLGTENIEITGFGYVGGLAGNSFGNIRDCHVTGDVTGGENNIGGLVGNNLGEIHNCYTKGSVTGAGRNVGGLAGYSNNVNNCYSNSDVKGSGYLGGLLGRSYGSISNSYATGSVDGTSDYIGGLVGYSHQSPINSCHATGSVKGSLEESRFVGGLAGFQKGPISDCFATGSVTANGWIGGLVGDTYSYSIITNCYATGDIFGNGGTVGGLAGRSRGPITDCYATGSVNGYGIGLTSSFVRVGGLVGEDGGSIKRSYSTSSVYGDGDHVGGLAGKGSGLIKDCYSTGSVEGIGNCIGGLLGFFHGKIFDCYATGSIIASGDNVGGLVGKIYSAQISNCYSIGLVACSGSDIGGLVGSNYGGTVTCSFWDIETGGPDNGLGTPLPTAQMQTLTTFTDAGWDFAGETVNGTEDIWFIPQQDYPHLWWEGMEVSMRLTPRTLNCRSQGNWVKAHLTLPEEFTVEDVDADRPAVLHSFGIESTPLYIFVNKDKLVEIEAAFRREDVCSLTNDWPDSLTVYGFFRDGSIFLGTSTVRIITPGLRDISELAVMWLEMDCSPSDWCGGMDLNEDSTVNFADFALIQTSEIEFISK